MGMGGWGQVVGPELGASPWADGCEVDAEGASCAVGGDDCGHVVAELGDGCGEGE